MSNGDPKADLELEKLREEIKKIKSENLLNEQARIFAAEDRTWWRWPRYRDVATIIVGVAPMLAVIVALLTLLANQEKDAVMQQREERKFVAELAEKIAHDNPTVRIEAVSSLATYLDREDFRPAISTALIGALLLEPDVTVRGALLSIIPGGESTAWQQTQAILPIARTKLNELDAEAARHEELVHQLRVEGKVDLADEVEDRFRSVRTQTTALQHAIVGLVIETRNLTPEAACTKTNACQKCRVALDNFYFDHFDFARAGFELCNVDFEGTSMVGSRFSGLNLSDAGFQGSELREAQFRDSMLVDANFSLAEMGWRLTNDGERPLTYFTGADLSGAKFSDACLSGANFRDARNLQPEQFSDAYAAGAKFDTGLEKRLAAAGALKSGPGCQQRF